MDTYGNNADPCNPAGAVDPLFLKAHDFSAARFVLRDDPVVYAYEQACRREDVDALLVLGSESFTNLRLSAMAEKTAYYAARLPGRRWQLGNEPDCLGRSSWTMTPVRYGNFVRRLAPILRASGATEVISAGMASGNSSYLSGCGELPLDAIAVHPYDKPPAPALALCREYERYGLPWLVTEWNRPAEQIGEWLKLFSGHRSYWFCWSDGMVPGFGLVDHSDKLAAFRTAIQELHMAEFVLGFKAVAEKLGSEVVGEPVTDEKYVDDIFGQRTVHLQGTTKGVMCYMPGGQPGFLAFTPAPAEPME